PEPRPGTGRRRGAAALRPPGPAQQPDRAGGHPDRRAADQARRDHPAAARRGQPGPRDVHRSRPSRPDPLDPRGTAAPGLRPGDPLLPRRSAGPPGGPDRPDRPGAARPLTAPRPAALQGQPDPARPDQAAGTPGLKRGYSGLTRGNKIVSRMF